MTYRTRILPDQGLLVLDVLEVLEVSFVLVWRAGF